MNRFASSGAAGGWRGDLRFLLASAAKDLRRLRRDPLSLVLWAGIPLTIGLLMNLAFGGNGTTPRARLLIDDRDGSFVSALLVAAFGQGELAEVVQAEQVDSAAGRSRIEQGDASALLVIPEGFGAAVLRERPAQLALVKNPAQRILPGIVEETLSVLVESIFYVQQLLREPVGRLVEGPPGDADAFPDSTIADLSVTVNSLVERARPYLFPPVIELENRPPTGDESPERSFGELFFPGMLVLAILFMAQGLSEDVWKERSRGNSASGRHHAPAARGLPRGKARRRRGSGRRGDPGRARGGPLALRAPAREPPARRALVGLSRARRCSGCCSSSSSTPRASAGGIFSPGS